MTSATEEPQTWQQRIAEQAEVLGPVLFAGMATALVKTRQSHKGRDLHRYPHLLPLTLRADLRDFLETEPASLGGWELAGNTRSMGELRLVHPGLHMDLRFLKGHGYPGGVPAAGSNLARREAWTDPTPMLGFPIPGAAHPTEAPVHLLLLWDVAGAGFTLRVVHTTAPGVYGKSVPCDLVLDITDGGSIFKRLGFGGDADETNFFAELEEEAEGTSDT